MRGGAVELKTTLLTRTCNLKGELEQIIILLLNKSLSYCCTRRPSLGRKACPEQWNRHCFGHASSDHQVYCDRGGDIAEVILNAAACYALMRGGRFAQTRGCPDDG